MGSLSQGRKPKTLLGRCIPSTQMAGPEISPSQLRDGQYYIGRNTVVMCKLKHGERKQDSPLAVRDYRVMAVYGKFYNKWWFSSENKKWCLDMDKTQPKKYRFAVRMVEDGTLEAYDEVCLTNDSYPVHNVVRMVDGTDIVGMKGDLASSIFNDVIN